ncbi:hypothetical protein D3C87_1084330 [compost metagenome]
MVTPVIRLSQIPVNQRLELLHLLHEGRGIGRHGALMGLDLGGIAREDHVLLGAASVDQIEIRLLDYADAHRLDAIHVVEHVVELPKLDERKDADDRHEHEQSGKAREQLRADSEPHTLSFKKSPAQHAASGQEATRTSGRNPLESIIFRRCVKQIIVTATRLH